MKDKLEFVGELYENKKGCCISIIMIFILPTSGVAEYY